MPIFCLRNCLRKNMLRFMSIEPMKEINLKKRRRVWKGNRKGQLRKLRKRKDQERTHTEKEGKAQEKA